MAHRVKVSSHFAKASRDKQLPKVSKAKKETVIFDKPQEKQKTSFFPRIFRFITERWILIVASLISAIIIAGIVLQAVSLYRNTEELKKIEAVRGETERELQFWKQSLISYPNSRDIYYRIAIMEYRLGNVQGAQENLQKALQIDPNFKKGRIMENQIRGE